LLHQQVLITVFCRAHGARSPKARKRLAVPFRAAHLPSERREYAQPDTALSLTTLAYYYDGLSQQQLLDALRMLLRLGLNKQQAYYREWLQVAGGDIPPGLTPAAVPLVVLLLR
jgi:hypothetical protein